MKKLLLVAAIAVFGFTANAQEVTFGVKGGVNFSNWDANADTDGITSFYIGGLADFALSESFHVQPELLFSSEGAESGDVDLGASFLRIPVMAKYYVADGLSLQAGPNFGFLISEDDALEDALKSFDVALGLGAGYELESGLFFDARYNLGLTDLSDVDGFETKTVTFQVGVGYRFN